MTVPKSDLNLSTMLSNIITPFPKLQVILGPLVCFTLCIYSEVLGEPSPEFVRRDKNMNGLLEGDELTGVPKTLLGRLDINRDGKISAREDETLYQQRRPNFTIQTLFYAANDNSRQTLDLLLPKQASIDPRPCLIFVHGGGWRSGNKSQGHPHLRAYVDSQKYVGVSVGYRLSGEAKWPAQLYDCKAAIRFLHANARKYKIDTKRIIVLGTSAGGHLASMIAVTGNQEELQGDVGNHLTQPSTVSGAISYYGPTDFLRMDDFPSQIKHNSADSPESQLIGASIQSVPDKTRQANPTNFLDSDDPPLICIHGDQDRLVPYNQSEILFEAMKERALPTALIRVKDGGHGGFANPAIKRIERQFINAVFNDLSEIPQSQELPNSAPR